MADIIVVKQKEVADAHYIGRGTPLGNPFVMGDESERDRVVDLYEDWLGRKLFERSESVVMEVARLYAKARQDGALRVGCHCAPRRCHGDVVKKTLDNALSTRHAIGASLSTGYEVSSKGDARFSALFATMPDGRTLEMHYQCDVKGFEPGGKTWKLGKGKPPKNGKSPDELFDDYVGLWRIWAKDKTELLDELYFLATVFDCNLKDSFAKTPVNQAVALATLINERSKNDF